jgi:bifunctional non-homologous end joining protein LigD
VRACSILVQRMTNVATKLRRSAVALPIRASHPDKVFWPDEGYTKGDLLAYYAEIFPKLRPFVRDRMLTLERCPDGMMGHCFYQKEKPSSLPESIPVLPIRHRSGTTRYVVGGQLETQLALVNLGCIAVHVWNSRYRAPRRPDWLCFDLDPGSGHFADAARAGLIVKEALDALSLRSFPKTSGARGLHVFVPLRVELDEDLITRFAAKLGERLATAFPNELTVAHRLAERGDRVYIDAYRNAFAQTVVAPYSVRRQPGASVSTPLFWREVQPDLDPSQFNIGSIATRVLHHDPWREFFRSRQSLRRAMRAIGRL